LTPHLNPLPLSKGRGAVSHNQPGTRPAAYRPNMRESAMVDWPCDKLET
jgi:hypothetical protein